MESTVTLLLWIFGPVVFGVAAREIFFHLCVAAGPEAMEVFGHLPRALIGRANVDEQWLLATANAGCFPSAEQMLHAHGDEGIAFGRVGDFGATVFAELEPLGGIFF